MDQLLVLGLVRLGRERVEGGHERASVIVVLVVVQLLLIFLNTLAHRR